VSRLTKEVGHVARSDAALAPPKREIATQLAERVDGGRADTKSDTKWLKKDMT
jgi:hypothetical protein